MARFRVILNASTGEKVEQAFSPEEEAEADAAESAALYQPLNRIQFEFMVEKLGIGSGISAAIEAMDDGDAKILARVLYRSGDLFVRSHPLFTSIAPAIGMTSDQIDAAWLSAMSV